MVEARQLGRLRLAGQRLSPAVAAADAQEAAAAVCGVQAQDPRAAALALRARVPGLEREAVGRAGLVRTWTVRGTLHLLPAADVPWLHAICAPRFLARSEHQLDKRGRLDTARGMLGDLLELIAERPRERSEILTELAAGGHEELGEPAVNVLMPWVALQGLAVGTPDGRWVACDPPPEVEEDEALAVMAARYLAGYGPARIADLAAWSGLPLRQARRAFEAAAPLEWAGELAALPGMLEAEAPEPADARLLPAFDTVLLGYRGREPILRTEHDRRVLPGGGMLRPAVLARGRVVGTWRLPGSGARRRLETEWFGRPVAAHRLAAEADDVARFLGLDAVEV